jgi:hypothetical protein
MIRSVALGNQQPNRRRKIMSYQHAAACHGFMVVGLLRPGAGRGCWCVGVASMGVCFDGDLDLYPS